jgi:hypothetical protein
LKIGFDFELGLSGTLCLAQPALSDSELAKEESYGCPLWSSFSFCDLCVLCGE